MSIRMIAEDHLRVRSPLIQDFVFTSFVFLTSAYFFLATATEFFLRFPALYPFLLGELARILKCSIQLDHNSWPTAVALNKTLADCNTADVLHPSLYPLLLFLSKMRAPLTSDIALTSTGVQINSLLFIPVLESCCSQKVFQVRVMVSKGIENYFSRKKIQE